MAARLPGPGPQISTGRLRVDAGRAIKKLREYQLADRTAWVLEAIRAAVASGATQISLSGDANDVWLAWEGEPWPSEVLPRLFDELVSPAAGSDVQHVRLLAAAVNSALGMDPAHVDVFRIDGNGTAEVARYTPDVLAEPTGDLEESPLQQVTTQATEPPDGAKPGMVVHLRRRISLGVLAYFVGAPPELALVEQACRDIAVPLHVRGHVLHRKESQDVFRIPLGEGIDGFIAISDRVIGEPQLEVAEHGVVLARYTLPLDDTDDGRAIPLRVFIDAPRMPTNASRSQVRRDKHPISTAEASAKKLIPDVIEQLGLAVTRGDERARSAALAWIAARIGGPHWHVDVPGLKGPLRELAKLPLVRNAVGEPRGLTEHWRSEIHTGRKPLPSELAAWLSYMLWIPPGDASGVLLQGTKVDGSAANRLVRWAKRQAAAQRKFYSHAKRDARVVAAKEPRVRVRLGAELPGSCVDQERFTNLSGEICVYAEGAGGSLVVLLEGRELERISIPSSIAFDAVIDSARAKPSDRYRGVQRDAEYTRIERAMYAGVIRAIEAISIDDIVDGYTPGEVVSAWSDAQLVRSALSLAREQGVKIRGPLTTAGAWQTTGERWVGVADLKGPAIGVTTRGRALIEPKNRIVVYADENERELIGKLYQGRVIRYDRARVVASPSSTELAALLAEGRPCAFGVRDGDLVGAIAPSTKSTVQLQHMGVRLSTQAYKGRYIDCAILVDSDAIIPDTDWKTALDDGGLGKRDYGAWELALIRALARALIGERQPDLRVHARIELRGPLGLALCQAFLDRDPKEMLGPQLFAGFCAAPLLTLVGRNGPASIDDLVEMVPAEGSIPVIHADAEPVPGFFPLLAPALVGQAIAKLANRKWHEASGEMARRQRRLLFDKNLAAHCAHPPEEVTVDVVERVAITGSTVRGHVGLGGAARGVRVYVEGRPFARLEAPDGLPLIAAVELAADHCNETFTEIPGQVAKKIAADVRHAVPALVLEIARTQPASLAKPGMVRTLLASCVDRLDTPTRATLAAAPAFRTVKDEMISLDEAWEPRHVIRIAAWQEPWLGPADGESATAIDDHVLSVSDDDEELRRIIEKLAALTVVDVSDEAARLQANRRMARGLLPTPKVNDVPAPLKRALSQLGEAGKKLGHGEIGLVDAEESNVRIHDHGRFVRNIPIKVNPAISLAVEEQDITGGADLTDIDALVDAFLGTGHPVTRTAQTLATELTRQVLADPAGRAALTPRMLRNFGRAVLGKKLEPGQVERLPVFDTIDGRTADWSVVASQIATFGDAWAVPARTEKRPLDENRIVLLLSTEELELAKANGFAIVAAESELTLDEEARRNRARPAISFLALPTQHGVMAEIELDGDGVTSPRGTVAVLTPAITGARGIHVHRGMQPLGTMPDPCAWPTLAVIDDARLVPNRTWSGPKQDQTWQAIQKMVRTASEAALDTLGEPPADALVSMRVDAETSGEVRELRAYAKSQVRGLMWLVGAPREGRVTVQVAHSLGVLGYVPDDGLGVGGQVFLYTPNRLEIARALEQLCARMHGKLVRQLLEQRADFDADLVAAHVAHALALDTIKPTEVRGLEFDCFVPKPLEPRALVGLLRRNAPVPVIMPDEVVTTEALVDDGSHVARVILSHIGKRARRIVPAPAAPTPAPPQPVKVSPPPQTTVQAPKPVAAPRPPKPPEPPHPLEGLMARLSKRVGELGIKGYAWAIEGARSPMFRYEAGQLVVAGNSERLRMLASQIGSNSPWLPAAIDALAAHVVSLLNIELTEITDATEMAALAALLANQPSAGPPRSRRSS